MGNTWQTFIKSILHILMKRHIQNYYHTSSRKRMRGLRSLPNNFIYHEIDNLYWKEWSQHLRSSYHNIGQSILKIVSINTKMSMKYLRLKIFLAVIWILQSRLLLGVSNEENICKKNILSDLIDNITD